MLFRLFIKLPSIPECPDWRFVSSAFISILLDFYGFGFSAEYGEPLRADGRRLIGVAIGVHGEAMALR